MSTETQVAIRQVPAPLASARDRLIDAMDMADLLGREIPCKQEPELFTSDLLAFNSGQRHMLAVYLAERCAGCPVYAECGEFVRSTRRTKSAQMFGVVAGYLVLQGTTAKIKPEGDA